MEVGQYTQTPVDFSVYGASDFKPHPMMDWDAAPSCGSNALATITGIPAHEIWETFKRERNLGDPKITGFLKKKGYKVIPITQCEISQHNNRYFHRSKIRRNHVVLCSLLLYKNEASWFVCHDGKIIHNFSSEQMNPFDFINKPLLTAYVIFHESWQNNQFKCNSSHEKKMVRKQYRKKV